MDNKLSFTDSEVIRNMAFDLAMEDDFKTRYKMYQELRDILNEKYTDYSDVELEKVAG